METLMEQQDERKIPPADLWDMKVAEGMSEDEATAYVAKVHGPPPMSIPAVRPDATMALQRERPDASGDWEAIPEGLKSAAAAAAMTVPINRAVGVAAKGAMRFAPVAGAVARELPFLRGIERGVRSGKRALNALPGKTKPIRGAAKAADETLEGLLRNPMDEMAEVRRAATLEEALANPNVIQAAERYRTASGALQKGAPKARFDYFAERMAQRAAKEAEEAAAPTLEDLLALSTQHVKKGGTMGDLIRMNPGRRPR